MEILDFVQNIAQNILILRNLDTKPFATFKCTPHVASGEWVGQRWCRAKRPDVFSGLGAFILVVSPTAEVNTLNVK